MKRVHHSRKKKTVRLDIFGGTALLIALMLSCGSETHFERLVGEWTIISIESRAEKVALDELLESKFISFTGEGNYQLGELQPLISGNWKIRGSHIQLIQPEVKDLNGRVVSRETLMEWELTVSEEWMIWRGTALNNTQHLKILLQKKK